jgi:hypothetical protein
VDHDDRGPEVAVEPVEVAGGHRPVLETDFPGAGLGGPSPAALTSSELPATRSWSGLGSTAIGRAAPAARIDAGDHEHASTGRFVATSFPRHTTFATAVTSSIASWKSRVWIASVNSGMRAAAVHFEGLPSHMNTSW